MTGYDKLFAHTVAARKQRDAARAKSRKQKFGARVGEDSSSWFNTPSARKARIMEVDDRIAQMGRDIDLATNVPPELGTQWKNFRKNWEDWVENLSTLGVLMPSTEEWANRQDEQLEEFRKAFEAAGVTTNFVKRPENTNPAPTMDTSTKILIGVTVATLGLALFYALKQPTVIHVPAPLGDPA